MEEKVTDENSLVKNYGNFAVVNEISLIISQMEILAFLDINEIYNAT